MTKTRSQTRTFSIKKEGESKIESKNSQFLNSVNTITTETRGKITKRRAPEKHDSVKKENHSLIQPIIKEEEEEAKIKLQYSQLVNNINTTINTKDKPIQREPSENSNSDVSISQVKSEEESDSKTLLKKTQPRQNKYLTQDQIERLIKYIVNDKMTATAASIKINICRATGWKYYNMYKNDPEQKIPDPRRLQLKNKKPVTHNQIKQLINYIAKDNKSIREASRMVNISDTTGCRYYKMYMEDPERKIPNPRQSTDYNKSCTQDQIKKLIDCIEKDGMNMTEASRKANISTTCARRCYLKYLNNPNHDIPVPGKSSDGHHKQFTKDQIKELISYIVDDRMTIKAASVKANMPRSVATKYYRKYLGDLETQNSLNINKDLTKQSPQE